MTGSEIRESFLTFFEKKGHVRVRSSSLVPKDDPSLLFTNAGMVQFKNTFLGREDRGYVRAVTSQKCLRAGGKHNDLENVGVTARHHTFFEMLGNFSFGDYFKEEAIAWAWEYLTGAIGLEKQRMWATVFRDDDEAFRIWHEQIGLAEDRIVRMDEKSNFWMMGDVGPCGPCSEIIYDQGEPAGCALADCSVGCDCDRYLEVWNIVFMQYDRDLDGRLQPLPKPNIDTGMGLERLAAVMQGKRNNYDSDLFADIIGSIEQIGRTQYGGGDHDVSIRVIADHARAVTFLVGDGVLPSNEGRGYVLRRILRRAARHGKLLGLDRPFLHEVCRVVVDTMRPVYPELGEKSSLIGTVVMKEEERFIETLDGGLNILAAAVKALQREGSNVIPGETVFALYDTHGFPVDLTADIVRKDGFTVDMEGFNRSMETQRERARESWRGSGDEEVSALYQHLAGSGIRSTFSGYDQVTEGRSRILALLKRGGRVSGLDAGEEGEIVVEQTPFYGESGGQVGDRGLITSGKEKALFAVSDTRRPSEDLIVHRGTLESGRLREGDAVHLSVNVEQRRAVEANHSGTHILQAAIRAVLGGHVVQAGSLVSSEGLRFDFTHFSRIDEEMLERIEFLANESIRSNREVCTSVMPLPEAIKMGATAVFDEKYGALVRVVAMGEISKELCGGTHVRRTGDIGLLKIVRESSIAAGVRRIEALTAHAALLHVRSLETEVRKAAQLLKSGAFEVAQRVEKGLLHQRDLEKELEALKARLALRDSSDLLDRVRTIEGISVLPAVVEAADAKTLRDLGDRLRDRLKSGIILLGSRSGTKAMLLCLVTSDLTDRYHAGKIVREIAPVLGGSGGGRADMAQAGGSHPEKLHEAMALIGGLLSGGKTR